MHDGNLFESSIDARNEAVPMPPSDTAGMGGFGLTIERV
jgi:hypothetical protein